jgi:DNA-binding MarR family transcriptional regulator
MEKKKIEELRKKLRMLERETGGVFDDQNQCCGVTTAQCHTILEIGGKCEISLIDLADALGLDTSTMSRTIQGLVMAGLVNRKASEEDRRYVKISLTEKGRRVYAGIGTRYNAYFREVVALLPEDRRDAVLSSVGEFADAVHRLKESKDCCRKGGRV